MPADRAAERRAAAAAPLTITDARPSAASGNDSGRRRAAPPARDPPAAGPAAGAGMPRRLQLPVAVPYVPTQDGMVLDVLAQLSGLPRPRVPPDVASSIASESMAFGSGGIVM